MVSVVEFLKFELKQAEEHLEWQMNLYEKEKPDFDYEGTKIFVDEAKEYLHLAYGAAKESLEYYIKNGEQKINEYSKRRENSLEYLRKIRQRIRDLKHSIAVIESIK